MQGSGASRLVQAIRGIAKTEPTRIEEGIVISPPPNIVIKLNSDGVELYAEDLVVAEHLLERDEQVVIDGYPKTIHHYGLQVGDRVLVAELVGRQVYAVIGKGVRF